MADPAYRIHEEFQRTRINGNSMLNGKYMNTESNLKSFSKKSSSIQLTQSSLLSDNSKSVYSSIIFKGSIRFRDDKNANKFSLTEINPIVSDNINKPIKTM